MELFLLYIVVILVWSIEHGLGGWRKQDGILNKNKGYTSIVHKSIARVFVQTSGVHMHNTA